jgi:hypothetical protein
MSYHVDHFFAAVSVLAGHGHIKQRLMKAYEDHLTEISEDELPVAAKQAFADLKHQMYRVTPLTGESPISASVRKMSVGEASECAASIVTVYGEIVRFGDGAQRSLPMDRADQVGVPPFLVKSN